MSVSNTYTWQQNMFLQDIKQRIHSAAHVLSQEPMHFDDGRESWAQKCVVDRTSQSALLQNIFVAADITDHGFCLYPLLAGGRYYGKINFRVHDDTMLWNTHALSGAQESDPVTERWMFFAPGSTILCGQTQHGIHFEVHFKLTHTLPFLHIELVLSGYQDSQLVSVAPEIIWLPGELSKVEEVSGLWLKPQVTPLADEIIAKNNSDAADPVRPADTIYAGLGITTLPAPVHGSSQREPLAKEASYLVCDRVFAGRELEMIQLPAVTLKAEHGACHFSLVIGIEESTDQFAAHLKQWQTANTDDELYYWEQVHSRLNITCSDQQITRQARYSVHNSLFSRSMTTDARTIFIHGRRDRGYADCAKIHQSYQMHYVALVAGETASVREELLAYAALQDERGDLAYSPRPGQGWHPYVGIYSNAHFLMALHRYLSWTQDLSILDEVITARDGTDGKTLFERMQLAADWILQNRWQGVIAPCGWCDAWPPDVKAQGNISAASCIALRDIAAICRLCRHDEKARYYQAEGESLARRSLEVFYDPTTGLFAEHLFASGELAAHTPDDFWAHTQVWAALAGLIPDQRALDLCRERCLTFGMMIVPETSMTQDYIAQSTDSIESLSVDSTATWLLATWPELTHLYALAKLQQGFASEALDAIQRQLPERLHERNALVSPYYYAEKYLYPDATPWLCTWSGDPNLILVLLEGFGGFQVDLEGMRVKPQLPPGWHGQDAFRARFQWLGQSWEYRVDQQEVSSGVLTVTVDGISITPGDLIRPEMLSERDVHTIYVMFA